MFTLEVRRWSAESFPHTIYFLLRAGVVVYVGRTSRLEYRLSHHRRDKTFDEVWSVDVEPELAAAAEMRLIKAYLPLYNEAGTGKAERFRPRVYVRQPRRHLSSVEVAL